MGRYEMKMICIFINFNENIIKKNEKSGKNYGGVLSIEGDVKNLFFYS